MKGLIIDNLEGGRQNRIYIYVCVYLDQSRDWSLNKTYNIGINVDEDLYVQLRRLRGWLYLPHTARSASRSGQPEYARAGYIEYSHV